MPRLVFHSTEPDSVPADIPALINALQNLGFIGEPWQTPKGIMGERYLVGENFLSLVTFMGCAPAIELAPIPGDPASTAFCHVEIMPVEDKVKFVRGGEHLVSRCPHCRQRHANWETIPENLIHVCDKCGVETPLAQYDWKNSAGSGRFFIHLHGIYPQEALPTSHLLQLFEKISGQKWSYFYIQ